MQCATKSIIQKQGINKVSAGLILTDGQVILGCKSFGRKDGLMDLPKGEIDNDDSPIETLIRECQEEANIDIKPYIKSKEFYDLGVYKYLPKKDLHLFLLLLEKNKLPLISQMKCSSFFEHWKTKKQVPEVVGYQYAGIQEIKQKFFKSLSQLLPQVIQTFLLEQGYNIKKQIKID